MADKLQFDLVSPERKLASAEVDRVQIPGAEGDLTAMPNHAPFLTTLRPGIVSVDGGETEYVVTGGFAELSPTGATVLAEEATPRAEATAAWIDEKTKTAEADLEAAADDRKAAAALRVNDFRMLAQRLGS